MILKKWRYVLPNHSNFSNITQDIVIEYKNRDTRIDVSILDRQLRLVRTCKQHPRLKILDHNLRYAIQLCPHFLFLS